MKQFNPDDDYQNREYIESDFNIDKFVAEDDSDMARWLGYEPVLDEYDELDDLDLDWVDDE